MNYIAHIHLAAISETSLTGNFAGDFIRGTDLSNFTDFVQTGIRLHRAIDSFTDAHEIVTKLKQQFPRNIRRTAGICLDIWFDHLLLQHNQIFPPLLTEQVFPCFYRELEDFSHTDTRFERVKDSLLSQRWLANYEQLETCLQAFRTVEKRLKYRLIFAEQSFEFMRSAALNIEREFLDFYPQLIEFTVQWARQAR